MTCGPAAMRNGLRSATLVNGGDCRRFVGGILQNLSPILDFRGNLFFFFCGQVSRVSFCLFYLILCVHIHVYISIYIYLYLCL